MHTSGAHATELNWVAAAAVSYCPSAALVTPAVSLVTRRWPPRVRLFPASQDGAAQCGSLRHSGPCMFHRERQEERKTLQEL